MAFIARYKCSDCGVYEVRTENKPRGRCPACPNCGNSESALKSTSKSNVPYTQEKLDGNVSSINESRHAPSLGKSNFTKAMDETAEIVMKDYGLTNLQDNLRAGDSMAPKLAPHLEQQVDQVFKPQKPIMGMNTSTNMNKALTNQINAGKFAGQSGARDITARAQASGYKVPTNVLFEHRAEKPN
jgi:hypothetical protein